MEIKPIKTIKTTKDCEATLKAIEGKRPLTMAMAWRLHQGLGIPPESLIRPMA